jgi:tetratricopeptide (TPR) repeat protein
MRLRSGDCDDLTILFMALMENLGVETAMADLPGHVLPLINSGVAPHDMVLITGDTDKLVVADDKVWIPVELTSVGVGFEQAWAQAALLCRKAEKDGKLGIVTTHTSWKKYAPATMAHTNWKPVLKSEDITERVEKEVTLIGRQRIDVLASHLLEILESNPGDVEARLELGILYAEHGYSDNAREEFEKVLKNDPENAFALNNLGNIHFLDDNYQAALEKYREAEAELPDDAEIKINLALTYYRLGNIEKAQEKFEEGTEADPSVVESNPILKELLYKQ